VTGTLLLYKYGIGSAASLCPAVRGTGSDAASGLVGLECEARAVNARWSGPRGIMWHPGETIEAELGEGVSPDATLPWGTIGGGVIPQECLSLRGRTVSCKLPERLAPGRYDLRLLGTEGRRAWTVKTAVEVEDRDPGPVSLDRAWQMDAGWTVPADGLGSRLTTPPERPSSARADFFLAGDCAARLRFIPRRVAGTLVVRVNSFCEAQVVMDRGQHGFLRLERNDRRKPETAYVVGEVQLCESLRPDAAYVLEFTRCSRVWTARLAAEGGSEPLAALSGRADRAVPPDWRVIEYGGWGMLDAEFKALGAWVPPAMPPDHLAPRPAG
jgi:hypothetical protein